MTPAQQILLAGLGLLRLLTRSGIVVEDAERLEFTRRIEAWAAKAQVWSDD